MFVQLRDSFERPSDVVQSWLRWFVDGITFRTAFLFAGLFGLVGWWLGWDRLPLFALILIAFAFTLGQFREPYIQARFAYAWRRQAQPPPLPTAPPRLWFRMTAATTGALIVVGTTACWLFFGVGWNSLPVIDRGSPWAIALASAILWIEAEIAVSLRLRREVRRRGERELVAEQDTRELA